MVRHEATGSDLKMASPHLLDHEFLLVPLLEDIGPRALPSRPCVLSNKTKTSSDWVTRNEVLRAWLIVRTSAVPTP